MFVPFSQWKPDADDTEVGTIVDLENIVPTMRGFKGSPTAVSVGVSALSAACRGAAFVTPLDGIPVLFAGTQTKLWKGGATAFVDVTRASDYTGSSTSKWRLAQQGNVTFAVNKIDTCQSFLHGTSTDFADLAAMPKCALVEAVGQFVLVGNNYDGATDTVDGWACSAIGDYTDWTASTTTQCTYGRLLDTPGEVTGLKRLGEYAIYFKRQSMYLARYVGAPLVWEFSLVSDVIGTVSQESIIRVGQALFFLGEDNFYSYDSASVQPIGDGIKEWFSANVNSKYLKDTAAVHDRNTGTIYWFYAGLTQTTLTNFVAYHYRTGRWGKGTMSIEAAAEYIAGSKSYDALETTFGTYGAFDATTYGALKTSDSTPLPGVFGTDHVVKTLTGVAGTATLTSNDFGMDGAMTMVSRVRPRYSQLPATASMTNYYRDNEGDSLTTDATTAEVSGKFDFMRESRWHRGVFTFTGDFELSGIDVTAAGSSNE
jgi:hypothetical protein